MKLLLLPLAAALAFGAVPELPRKHVNTQVESRGKSLHVSSSGDLQETINAAKPGDTIYLESGATFTGAFILPPKTGNGWITITTSTPLPAAGTRITRSYFPKLAKIISPNSRSSITFPAGAKQYRLLGVEVAVVPTAKVCWTLINAAPGSSEIIIDRSYVHANPRTDSQRAIAVNGESIAVVNSHIDEIHYVGFDSQAIIGWAGPGPYRIENNYLAGSGENIMFGGAKAPEGVTPSDIVVRGNWIHKPESWRTTKYTVKNLFELKHAQRVLVEDNVLEGNWLQAQTGSAVLFTVRAGQSGCHAVVNDITFRNNVIKDTLSGFSLLGRDDTSREGCRGESQRVAIEGNLIVKSPTTKAPHGVDVSWGPGTEDYTLRNNTFTWSTPCRLGLFFNGKNPVGSGVVITNNVFCQPTSGDAVRAMRTLTKFIPDPEPIDMRYQGNLMFAARPAIVTLVHKDPFPEGNEVTTESPFVDAAAGDWRLKPEYKECGADIPALNAMAAAVTGDKPVYVPKGAARPKTKPSRFESEK